MKYVRWLWITAETSPFLWFFVGLCLCVGIASLIFSFDPNVDHVSAGKGALLAVVIAALLRYIGTKFTSEDNQVKAERTRKLQAAKIADQEALLAELCSLLEVKKTARLSAAIGRMKCAAAEFEGKTADLEAKLEAARQQVARLEAAPKRDEQAEQTIEELRGKILDLEAGKLVFLETQRGLEQQIRQHETAAGSAAQALAEALEASSAARRENDMTSESLREEHEAHQVTRLERQGLQNSLGVAERKIRLLSADLEAANRRIGEFAAQEAQWTEADLAYRQEIVRLNEELSALAGSLEEMSRTCTALRGEASDREQQFVLEKQAASDEQTRLRQLWDDAVSAGKQGERLLAERDTELSGIRKELARRGNYDELSQRCDSLAQQLREAQDLLQVRAEAASTQNAWLTEARKRAEADTKLIERLRRQNRQAQETNNQAQAENRRIWAAIGTRAGQDKAFAEIYSLIEHLDTFCTFAVVRDALLLAANKLEPLRESDDPSGGVSANGSAQSVKEAARLREVADEVLDRFLELHGPYKEGMLAHMTKLFDGLPFTVYQLYKKHGGRYNALQRK